MEYKKLVSIVGKPGLWEIVNQRPDGLITRPITGGRTQFISSRLNQFTLLENISIYTEDDVETLEVIFQSIIDKEKTLAVPEKNSPNEEIKKYFKEILPNYDEDKVYVSDIKKVIKWYNLLKEHDLADILKRKKEEEEKAKKELEKKQKEEKKEAKEKKEPSEKEEKTAKKEVEKKAKTTKKAEKTSETTTKAKKSTKKAEKK